MAAKPTRLFLLPISTRRTLIYCERHAPANLPPGQQPPWSDRIINKAASTWGTWEKAEKGWQKSITRYGNNLFKRIAFEEWGLKSIPPATKKRLEDVAQGKLQFECVYPEAVLKESSRVRSVLEKLATERQGLHNRNLWSCIAWMPVSFPFTFVPIIPNLPFYYLCFRAWSHYRALYGSRMLAHLVQAKNSSQASTPTTLQNLTFTASPALDALYKSAFQQQQHHQNGSSTTPTTSSKSPTSTPPAALLEPLPAAGNPSEPELMLLTRSTGIPLAQEFGVPELQMEVERAVEQVEARIAQERAKLRGRDANEGKKA